jgi:hypothetical protein
MRSLFKNSYSIPPWQLRAAFSGHGSKKSNLYSEGITQQVLIFAILTLVAYSGTSGSQRTITSDLGAVYTCDFAFESAYDSVNNFLYKGVSDFIFSAV